MTAESPNQLPTDKQQRIRFAKCDPAWLGMDLTERELKVILALSLHANWAALGHGRCFPKRDTLALATKLQISHISEAVRSLSERHGLITVVRLGRKNLYYVRAIGVTERMPPSNAVPFFKYLGNLGVRLVLADGQLAYAPGSKRLEDRSLLLAIVSDYVQGLIPRKLREALEANKSQAEGSVL